MFKYIKRMISADHFQKTLSANRPKFDDLVKRRFIFVQSAEIYGGVAGLYDYGPIGTGIKNNIISQWRKHFIVEEDLLEITCSTLTPQVVLKHSGHEARFADWMVKDPKTNETFRADHLIEGFVEEKLKDKATKPEEHHRLEEILRNLPNFKEASEFDAVINELKIVNPVNKKNQLGATYPFNLMFDTKIGPLGDQKAYLRPETAQAIFVNFKRLLEFKNGKLPFGGSIIGLAYRNEIAPRNGLLRVREFEMAEIEYFIDPNDKKHPKFASVAGVVLPLFHRKAQTEGHPPEAMTIGDAVSKGVIANEMLGYFIGRTFMFAVDIGIKPELVRFRQHQSGEMAHYATDCWDMEILSSFGWVECVGLADRSAYDLTAHMKGSGEKMVASRVFEKPIAKDFITYDIDRAVIGKTHKQHAKAITDALEDMKFDDLKKLKEEIEADKKSKIGAFEVTDQMIKNFKIENKMVQEEKFVPNVIEPSFGIGRIVYCLLEQSFLSRETDDKRTFFSFKPVVAPYKVVFLPLMNKDKMVEIVEKLEADFRKAGIMCKSDSGSGAIGKRYARTDEMGIPFAVTVDFETIEHNTVTLREIISMEQIRVPIADLKSIVMSAIEDIDLWKKLQAKYPSAKVNENEEQKPADHK